MHPCILSRQRNRTRRRISICQRTSSGCLGLSKQQTGWRYHRHSFQRQMSLPCLAPWKPCLRAAGIALNQDALEPNENSILLSILGQCAMALENEQTAMEKEQAAVLAKNEQLSREPFPRHFPRFTNASHFYFRKCRLRCFLQTKIPYLPRKGDSFIRISMTTLLWLINLVENLLSVTRIEDGSMNFRLKPEPDGRRDCGGAEAPEPEKHPAFYPRTANRRMAAGSNGRPIDCAGGDKHRGQRHQIHAAWLPNCDSNDRSGSVGGNRNIG